MDINIGLIIAQIINFLIIFFVFKHFLWNIITKEIENRRKMLSKLKNAETEYANIISKAESEAKIIVDKSLKHKISIIDEWVLLAQKEKEKIIQAAEKEAILLKEKSELESQKIKDELTNNWEEWIKSTTKLVVKKLIWSDVELKDNYINSLIKEATN